MEVSERARPWLRQTPQGGAGNLGSGAALGAPQRCTDADIAGALQLSDAAQWNQTAADWQVFMHHGHVLGIRSATGMLVATAAALPYGARRGWISMVLVQEAFRHRGLATQLLALCVEHLQQRGLTPILDATPAGAATYQKAGFRSGFALARWQGAGAKGEPLPEAGEVLETGVRAATTSDLPAIARLDAQANGIERDFLLRDMLERAGGAGWMQADGSGFVLCRRGGRATQVGPLVASDESAATGLLHCALHSIDGPVFLDLPARWSGLTRYLVQRGFVQQRPFVRMALGPADIEAAQDRMFLLAGPEFG